jgi:glucose-6-phosphate 1-epimerase
MNQSSVNAIESENHKNKLIIDSQGVKIKELILDGQKILTEIVRGDNKKASSHPCIPQFGKTNLYNLPQHGSARNMEFASSVSQSEILLGLDIHDGEYPDGLRFKQKNSLTDEEYELTTEIANNSLQDLPVNFAQHFYWATPVGWESLRINGVNVAEIVKSNAPIDAKEENIIEIPGQNPIILIQQGFSNLHLWAYKSENGKYDQNYVCIEPTEGEPERFGAQESIIHPGKTKIFKLVIINDQKIVK